MSLWLVPVFALGLVVGLFFSSVYVIVLFGKDYK